MAKSETTRNRLQLYWDHSDPTQHYTCMVLEHLKALPARQKNEWLCEAVTNQLARFLEDDPKGMSPSLQSAHHFARLLAKDLGISLSANAQEVPAIESSPAPRSEPVRHVRENKAGESSDNNNSDARRSEGPHPTEESEGNDQRPARADTEQKESSSSADEQESAVKNTALGAKLRGMMA
ncbi:hypothetical protein EZI54_07280 [Marinobacter halodurans]|uniref:Uncharacterized protein n=1 Tax=Marinobacter halodurans TaxID=2528979 RepID=A0ABY1ZMD2_9GAMM|nr:hypothetical protein [Marinobacter halodurans]TBW57454.1 hypothetical protein EZI54_07280 [Marinobacter halodurans]